ncbi:MAG: site-2 protease family protein, partial [Polyangiaceae bacterium]|nr:site-2 protease family protein [Polyangiaceae bacterium]
IAGMNPHEEVEANDPETFQNKSVFARVLTIAAGPAANYLAASIIAFSLAMTSWPLFDMPVVGMTVEGSPAATAGLERGDTILEANGKELSWFSDLRDATAGRVGLPTEYLVERDGRTFSVTMTPAPRNGKPEEGVIGVAPAPDLYGSYGAAEAASLAIRWPYQKTVEQIVGISGMFEKRSMDDLGGVVVMTDTFARAADAGWVPFLMVFAWISTALGFFNLLPFPALDGGRLVFLSYEAITRRRANDRVEAAIHTAGILFLLGLMVFVTYRDVLRLFKPE